MRAPLNRAVVGFPELALGPAMVGGANFEAETAANRASIFEHTMSFLARNLSVRDCDAERHLFELFLGISISALSVAVLRQKRFGKLSLSLVVLLATEERWIHVHQFEKCTSWSFLYVSTGCLERGGREGTGTDCSNMMAIALEFLGVVALHCCEGIHIEGFQ
jgi:hypothetical protein